MDEDLKTIELNDAIQEIIKLRNILRTLRDRNGHDLCWYNPEIWEVLPEKIQPNPTVPNWCEFMQNCAEFRKSLDLQRTK